MQLGIPPAPPPHCPARSQVVGDCLESFAFASLWRASAPDVARRNSYAADLWRGILAVSSLTNRGCRCALKSASSPRLHVTRRTRCLTRVNCSCSYPRQARRTGALNAARGKGKTPRLRTSSGHQSEVSATCSRRREAVTHFREKHTDVYRGAVRGAQMPWKRTRENRHRRLLVGSISKVGRLHLNASAHLQLANKQEGAGDRRAPFHRCALSVEHLVSGIPPVSPIVPRRAARMTVARPFQETREGPD